MYQLRGQEQPGAVSSAIPVRTVVRHSPALIGIMALTIVNLPRLHELVGFFVYLELGKIAVLVSVICLIMSKAKNPLPWMRLPQVALFICFVSWIFISAFFGVWTSASIEGGLGYLKLMLFFYLLIKSVNTTQDLGKLIWVLMLAMIVFDISIILQHDSGRASSGGYTLDPNESSLLITTTISAFYFFYRANSGLRRLVCLAGMVLGVAAVFLTASRGGVISLSAVIIYCFFVEKRPVFKKIALVAVVGTLIFLFMPQTLKDRLSVIGDESIDYNMTDRHGRMMVWERALSIIEANPLFGVGMYNFTFVDSDVNNQSKGMVAHNFLLQTATELGIPGVVLIVSIFTVSWAQMCRLRKRLIEEKWKHDKAIVASIETGLVAFFVGGQFLSVAFSAQIIFLVGCSVIIHTCYLRRDFDGNELGYRKQHDE